MQSQLRQHPARAALRTAVAAAAIFAVSGAGQARAIRFWGNGEEAPAGQRLAYPGRAREAQRQAVQGAHGKVGEGLRLQRVAVPAHGLDRRDHFFRCPQEGRVNGL